jgi:trimeric autotransporter adhesin
MSTKTIYKRIALVAVAALGAGVLSVAPANAADGAIDGVAATGLCATQDSAGAYQSIGDTSVTITIALGGTVTTSNDGDLDYTLSASGGGVMTGSGGTSSSALAYAVSDDADTAVFTPSVVGTVKISLTADATPVTVADYVNVVTVASCSIGTFSAGDSEVHINTVNAAASGNVDDTPVFADEATAWILIDARNQYGANLASGTWLASATNGAVVDIAAGSVTAAGSLSQDILIADGSDIRVAVAQPVALQGTPLQTTVTVTYGTQTIATKTILFTGDLAKIEVSKVLRGKTNDENFGSFTTKTFDSAGNQIEWADASLTVTGTDQNVVAADAGITSAVSAANGDNSFTCGVGAKGTTNLTVKGLTNAGTYVYSTPFAATCSSTPYTWTVSMDKASYVPGDIAVVTISAKDSNGNAVHDPLDQETAALTSVPDTFSYVAGDSTTVPVVTGSNLEAVVAPTAANYFVGGVKTYNFKVLSTEGDYNLSVILGGITTDVAKTVKYSIKASSATVSNADVLKAIVSLIASINKQIAALQRALLRR